MTDDRDRTAEEDRPAAFGGGVLGVPSSEARETAGRQGGESARVDGAPEGRPGGGASTIFDLNPDGDEGEPPPPPRRGHRRWVVVLAALAVVVLGLVLAWRGLAPVVGPMFESKDFEGPGGAPATIVVRSGDTGRAIGQTLVDAGVVKTTKAFEDALSSTPGNEIQPGSYLLKREMKAADAASAMRSGAARNVHRVTIREGLRAGEIYAALSKATGLPLAHYTAAAKKPAALGLPAAAKGHLEGYLFPATYQFDPGTSAADQLKRLIGQATGRWSALGVQPATMQQTITIASIVEAEARRPQDRPKVAAVIENRLRQGMPLQMDSTVAYGVGKRTLTTTDAERAHDNPYNTYLHPGLPAGPIGNPGAASVQATLHPAKGNWLFFVTVNPTTGENKFAATKAEHDANVKVFQQWCRANPGRC